MATRIIIEEVFETEKVTKNTFKMASVEGRKSGVNALYLYKDAFEPLVSFDEHKLPKVKVTITIEDEWEE